MIFSLLQFVPFPLCPLSSCTFLPVSLVPELYMSCSVVTGPNSLLSVCYLLMINLFFPLFAPLSPHPVESKAVLPKFGAAQCFFLLNGSFYSSQLSIAYSWKDHRVFLYNTPRSLSYCVNCPEWFSVTLMKLKRCWINNCLLLASEYPIFVQFNSCTFSILTCCCKLQSKKIKGNSSPVQKMVCKKILVCIINPQLRGCHTAQWQFHAKMGNKHPMSYMSCHHKLQNAAMLYFNTGR